MRTIRRLIEAKKVEREENGEAGFSLIELIIVVVILGILVAVAIPIFMNIQDQARQSAADAIAGNGATQAAALIAQNEAVDVSNLEWDNMETGESVAYANSNTPADIEGICVTVVKEGKTGTAGPGCTAPTTP